MQAWAAAVRLPDSAAGYIEVALPLNSVDALACTLTLAYWSLHKSGGLAGKQQSAYTTSQMCRVCVLLLMLVCARTHTT
jgi:hypothetical protein